MAMMVVVLEVPLLTSCNVFFSRSGCKTQGRLVGYDNSKIHMVTTYIGFPEASSWDVDTRRKRGQAVHLEA